MKNVRVAAVTIVRNSDFFLRKWRSHYGSLFGSDHLYVIHDGVLDQSDPAFMPNDIQHEFRRSRKNFDMEAAEFQSKLCNKLLNDYDIVIRTDVDELLTVDPLHGGWSDVYEECFQSGYVYSLGLDVVHRDDIEPSFDLTNSIFSQREHGILSPGFSKPHIISQPVRWTSACHTVFDKDLIVSKSSVMLHIGLFDRDQYLQCIEERGDLDHRSRKSYSDSRSKRFRALQKASYTDYDIARDLLLQNLTIRVSEDRELVAHVVSKLDGNHSLRGGYAVRVPERLKLSL